MASAGRVPLLHYTTRRAQWPFLADIFNYAGRTGYEGHRRRKGKGIHLAGTDIITIYIYYTYMYIITVCYRLTNLI